MKSFSNVSDHGGDNDNASELGSSVSSGNLLASAKKKKQTAIDLRRVPGVDVMADKALIGYLKIIAEINRNKAILKYREEPRLTNNGTKDFKVRMGFGMHAGWAIEGAVGSLQKVTSARPISNFTVIMCFFEIYNIRFAVVRNIFAYLYIYIYKLY